MTIARVLAALHLPPRPDEFTGRCNAILLAMDGNDNFPNPNPALTLVTTHVNDYSTAQATASTRVHGAVEARDVARRLVVSDMQGLKVYVQRIADGRPGDAAAIITSARMMVVTRAMPQKQIFSAEDGEIASEVIVYAPALKDATYDWQMSANRVDWVSLPSTRQANTTVVGLPRLTEHHFRYRTLTREKLSDWSTPISHFVR